MDFVINCRTRHKKFVNNCPIKDIVKLLMENAATFGFDLDVKLKYVNGDSAFYLACAFGHSDVVKLLMENAANLILP